MLKKSYSKTGRSCRVTFKLPAEVEAGEVSLLGEFNEWNRDSHQMKQLKDGSFSLTVSLPAGQDYRFRYLLDGDRWENDWAADDYLPNQYGTEDSLVAL
ncbi:MAG: isoamylase early set domain-containing protein [Chloroflexota bacterium]